MLEIEPGTYLAESNAILWYLADGTPLLPAGALQRAQVLQWLFFEQYSHEPFIAVARFLRKFHPDPEAQRTLADSKMDGGYRALDVMEGQLTRQPFFVGDRYSIADIGLYAYTVATTVSIRTCRQYSAWLDICPGKTPLRRDAFLSAGNGIA